MPSPSASFDSSGSSGNWSSISGTPSPSLSNGLNVVSHVSAASSSSSIEMKPSSSASSISISYLFFNESDSKNSTDVMYGSWYANVSSSISQVQTFARISVYSIIPSSLTSTSENVVSSGGFDRRNSSALNNPSPFTSYSSMRSLTQ